MTISLTNKQKKDKQTEKILKKVCPKKKYLIYEDDIEGKNGNLEKQIHIF